jgi:predicted dehydrogenase
MSEPTPLRAAVIGCGAIAYDHLPFLAASPRARLVAVCDRSAALSTAAAERFGAEGSFVDVSLMVSEAKPDIVHVLTPPHTHYGLVSQILAAGAHVICEKPMTGTERETAELLNLAAAAGVVLQESRNLLFNDSIMTLQSMIADGRLGRVVECEVLLSFDFLSGPFGDTNLSGPAVQLPGGAAQDFIPHLAYLFLCLGGIDKADGVRGTMANRSGNPRVGFDYLDALLQAGDVRGRLRIATDTAPSAFKVIVRGSVATVETDLYNPCMVFEGSPNVGKRAPLGQIVSGVGLIRAGLSGLKKKIMQHGTMHGMPRMLDAIYTAIGQGAPPPFAPEEILASARLTDQLIALGEHP